MPIGGFIIHILPEKKENILFLLQQMPEVEVHGHDDLGNLVTVIDALSMDSMQAITKKINMLEGVLSIGLTYLNMEDEVDRFDPAEKSNVFHTDKNLCIS